ncbi:hypothetical protein BD324DRAFT_612069 [Kockovaella imperatae]|uniref:Uncharacterized protein n=1 Tax=Kockovaella imperatae TaxID=4999 RepID=A0A1Y1UTB8_9TREE|nr:hypothetical protein BD324DRAFT_612069 [Kockovaella imperatae]ORX40774.1 hypothetical protein BD324DRAFT_612069 [Kockovaella imperatae]
MECAEPPPPYLLSAPSTRSSGPATISSLPLHILHRIVSLTLDPNATPSRFAGDWHEEKVRRIWGLFRGLRPVDRRFYKVSTSILRGMYINPYLSLLPRGTSSNPFPHDSDTSNLGPDSTARAESVFKRRSRETAVFDRFIANRVGEDLRRVESELYEESEAEMDIIKRLQPIARTEDLLLRLPPSLILPEAPPGRLRSRVPLPHPHLVINLTPTWCQVYLSTLSIGSIEKNKAGRDLVIEVKRQRTPEETVRKIGEGLEDIQRGMIRWGDKVY